MEGVAYRNLQNFSTNLKAGHEFDQRHLEAEFGQSKFSEPCLRRGKMDVEFFSIQHQFFLVLSSYRKVMAVLPNHFWVRVSKVRYQLGLEIG
jgi:hypothetical protein